jgi:hypothetical protein
VKPGPRLREPLEARSRSNPTPTTAAAFRAAEMPRPLGRRTPVLWRGLNRRRKLNVDLDTTGQHRGAGWTLDQIGEIWR